MVAIDFRSWKITLNPVEHHSEPDGAALSLLRSKEATWRFALDVRVQANDLECRIPAVERARSEERGGRVQFIPYRFEFSNKLTKQHKLMLAFDAFVPSDAIGRDIRLGMLCPIFHLPSLSTLLPNLP
jgi:hypothetical protein